MRVLLALALYIAAVGAYVSPARGQVGPICQTHAAMVERLARDFGQVPAAVLLAEDGGVIEVFLNRTDGTWSILKTFPGEPTCRVGWGQGFETVKPVWGEPT